MNAKHLSSLWAAPDNNRLTAKQQSFRLPVHVAAKIAALCELYPNKTKTQLVGDLLASALAEMERGLPAEPGAFFTKDENGKALYVAVGIAQDYRNLSNKHFAELERELGNESPQQLFTSQLLFDENGQ